MTEHESDPQRRPANPDAEPSSHTAELPPVERAQSDSAPNAAEPARGPEGANAVLRAPEDAVTSAQPTPPPGPFAPAPAAPQHPVSGHPHNSQPGYPQAAGQPGYPHSAGQPGHPQSGAAWYGQQSGWSGG